MASYTVKKLGGLFSGTSGVDLSLLDNLPALSVQLNSSEKSGGVLNDRDSNGYTLLHHAAMDGHVEALKILLSKDANPNCHSLKQVTPVHLAAGSGHLECLRLLLECGGSHDQQDSDKRTPLDYAQQGRNTLCEGLLLKHFAYLQDISSEELFRVLSELELLIKADPILNSFEVIIMDPHQNLLRPVNCDVLYRKYSLNCHSLLLSSVPAAQANAPKILINCNILHVSCQLNHLLGVQYLLQKHPDMLYAVSREGYNPLHIAVLCNNVEVVNYILQHLLVTCKQGLSPKLPAHAEEELVADRTRQHLTLSNSTFPARAISLVNAATGLGHTVLHLAAILNHATILYSLLLLPDPLQLDTEVVDNVEFTPLHAATFANASEAVEVLLSNNANPNCSSSLTTYTDVFRTPLAQACAFRYDRVFDRLVEKGAIDKDLAAVKRCLSLGDLNNDTFFKVLATFIKKDELSRRAKLHRRVEGFSISKAVSVDWSTIPLKHLEMEWLKSALVNCPILSPTKVESAICNITSLSLSSCSLSVLPLEIFQLTAIISINVSDNKLMSVPAQNQNCALLKESGWTCNALAKLDFSSNQITDIPDFLFELPGLKVLNISSNYISTVSMKLWFTPQLCEFRCSHNNIFNIPSDWEECLKQVAENLPLASMRVRSSKISGRLSASFHSFSKEFSTITEDSEDYTVTPPINIKQSHGYLYNSEESDSDTEEQTRSSNTLTSQPTLQNRRIIASSSGLIVDWDREPDAEDKSDFLMLLDFSYNHLTTLPPDLACLAPKLIRLDVSHNQLNNVCIPKGFPADLKHLNLSYNPLNTINSESSFNVALPCTNPCQEQGDWNCVAYCQHRSHSQLVKLQALDLDSCELTSVNFYTPVQSQKELSDKIKIAEASNMKLGGEDIPLLKAVRSSSKTFHELKSLAKLVFPLLSRLVLKRNNLHSIPESVCDMVALSTLDFSYNPIIELNKEMGQLYNLWEFPLDGLQLISPPQNILGRGKTKDIVGFLCSLLQRSQPYHRMKLMLVGRSARGKTSLLNKITEKGLTSSMPRWGEREQRPSAGADTPVTVGIAVSNWTYTSRHAARGKVKRITFKTWDFAGQEDYYATHQYFLSQRSLYLAVWNASHGSEGVEELKSWLLNIQARAPSSPVIVVGTHGDKVTRKNELYENLQLIATLYGDENNQIQGYPPIMGSVIVSSVTGAGIKDLREKIFTVASEMKETRAGARRDGVQYKSAGNTRLIMDQLVPASYLQLEDTVRKIAQHYHTLQKPPVLSAQEFRREVFKDRDICISKDINDKELEQAVRFLHDNGTLLHYEDTVLNDFYFVDPQWLCDLLAHIVTVEQINPFVKDGIMMLKKLTQIFRSKDFPNRWQKEYLHLLTRFEVAIQLDKESILIPSFLPEKPPTLPKTVYPPEVVCLPPIRNFLKTTFVPVGFWSRLMSRLFADTSIELLAMEGCGITKGNEATSPSLNWTKSRCSLEYQYGNLTLFRLAEVGDMYLTDPTIKTVTILQHGHFDKIPNKGFHGITMDVMDIYPVIKYCEIKFAERLASINEHDALETKGKVDEFTPEGVKDDISIITRAGGSSTENNIINDAVEAKSKGSGPLGREQMKRKHSYDTIEYQDGIAGRPVSTVSTGRKTSQVYESLDLAMNFSTSVRLRAGESPILNSGESLNEDTTESPAVRALDLEGNFRTRSLITVSCKPEMKDKVTTSVNIAHQRSLLVANELSSRTVSRADKTNLKSGSQSSDNTNRSFKSSHSQSNRKSRSRRSTRHWNKPKPPLVPLGVSEAAHDRMRAGLLTKVMDHIEILVHEWFSGIKPQLLIPCPYCMVSKAHTTEDNPIHLQRAFSGDAVMHSLTNPVMRGGNDPDTSNAFVFSFDDCVWKSRNFSIIYCPAHGDIPLEFFVPDVTFASLGKDVIVRKDQVTVLELLGEGTYAKVFKATLKQEKPPFPVEVKTVAMKAFTKKEWTGIERTASESISEIILASTQINDLETNQHGSVDLHPKRPVISIETMSEAHHNMRCELSVLSQLNHDNILSLVGVMVSPPSILLEYAPMGTIKEVYKMYKQSSQQLPPDVSQITIIQLASGIEFLHKRSIVYRDLKSDNILAWRFPMPNNLPPFPVSNYDVHVKLADYGVSQFANINGLLGYAGTPGFIAPEIIKYHGKEVYTNKVDIFSLGMVIYEMITLHPPYEKFNHQQANQAIESGVRPSLSKKDLNSLILQRELMIWCWQQDPDMRPTATQVVEVAKSEQFCRLVDGIRIDDNARVLCACQKEISMTMHRKYREHKMRKVSLSCLEMSSSMNQDTEDQSGGPQVSAGSPATHSVSEGQFVYEVQSDELQRQTSGILSPTGTLQRKLDAVCRYELWVSCSDIHCSRVTVLDYCGKFTGIQDLKVGTSPILSICLVNNMIWMGSEIGYLYIYDAIKRLPLAQAWLEETCPILSIIHIQETQLVYIAMEDGSVFAVRDDISCQLITLGVSPAVVNLEVVAKHRKLNSISACLTAVPTYNSSFEIWVGQKNRSITVLDAENLEVVAILFVSSDVSKVSHYIAHLTVANLICHRVVIHSNTTSDGGGAHDQASSLWAEKESISVFAAVYHGQFITQLDANTKECVDLITCADYLRVDKNDCNISSLHIVDMNLFVGLLNGKLLLIDLQSMSPVAVFHCHEDRVKPIFSLTVDGGSRQSDDATKHQLISCGSGFKSYFKNEHYVISDDGSILKRPSQLLVWDIDRL